MSIYQDDRNLILIYFDIFNNHISKYPWIADRKFKAVNRYIVMKTNYR